MPRLRAIFVAICMIVIAGALGAVLHLLAGTTAPESILVAGVALAGLSLYHMVTTRLRDRFEVGGQIADLSRGTHDLARQVAELGRRVVALEGQGDVAGERARAATEPLAAEIGELGTLVKQLADSVAVHDTRITAALNRPAPSVAEAAGAVDLAPVIVRDSEDAAIVPDACALNRYADATPLRTRAILPRDRFPAAIDSHSPNHLHGPLYPGRFLSPKNGMPLS